MQITKERGRETNFLTYSRVYMTRMYCGYSPCCISTEGQNTNGKNSLLFYLLVSLTHTDCCKIRLDKKQVERYNTLANLHCVVTIY